MRPSGPSLSSVAEPGRSVVQAPAHALASSLPRQGTLGLVWGVVLAVLVCACGQTDLPSVAPTPSPAATFALVYGPPNQGCPLVAASNVTFRIDPSADEPVMAVEDDGTVLHVQWPQGFVAGTKNDPVVRDRTGLVVARDGQRLIAPKQGFPKLPGGWGVCFGDDAIWVQEFPVP
jgi:hypothetical protein